MMSLPILSSRFFKKHRPDGGFFSKWSSYYSWNEHILPIYEWQGVLFVGCSRPPAEFPRMGQKKVVFVLCEPGVLQEIWLDFQAPPSVDGKPAKDEAAAPSFQDAKTSIFPNPFSGVPKPPEETNEDLQHSFSTDFSNLADEPEEGTPKTAFREPQATAIFNPKDLKEEDPLESLAQENQELSNTTPAESLEMPEGLSLDVTSPTSSSTAPAEPAELTLLDTEDSEEVTAPSQESEENLELLDLTAGGAATAAQEPSQSITLKLKEETNPLSPAASPKSSEDELADLIMDSTAHLDKTGSQISTSPSEKRATPIRSEVIAGSDVTRWSHQVLNSASPQKVENWLHKLFEELHKDFKKSMVLLKSGDLVKPWKWDPLFKQDPSTRSDISLVQPSPFRIVARTKKPYHGYVVSNDINKKFFSEWNESHIPEHLTIAPILVDDHVIGVLLAIGEKSADSKEALQLAETIANDIATQIQAQPNLRAA